MIFGAPTKHLALVVCYVSIAYLTKAQSIPLNYVEQQPTVFIQQTKEQIQLDGLLSESVWQIADKAKNFAQNFPSDSILATHDTEIQMAYDNDYLYIAIKCHAAGSQFITPSLRRDYDFFGNDNITLLFDTYNDRQNALVFGINPYGVRREATIANAGQQGDDFDDSWDNKWDGAAQIHGNSWTAELAIPFKTLRYKAGSTHWRFNAYRYDTQDNEISSWISIPSNRFTIDLGFMGNMEWEKPLTNKGVNISIIPYVSGILERDLEDPSQTTPINNYAAGADAKIGINAGLNLDLTYNPDFSQVEVDQQVTNLSRFELIFPERRQFFLENADLFSTFGANRLNPFFSRRIGISFDSTAGQNIQNQITYGVRLSGKINERLRIGLLNMQTAEQVENNLPSFNYTVAVAEQRIQQTSTIRAIAVNKQATNADNFTGAFNEYNRTLGLEYRLNSRDNRWTMRSSYQRTFTPNLTDYRDAHITQVIYNRRKYRLEWLHFFTGANYNPEVGFAPRKDILLLSPEGSINFFPKNAKIGQHTVGFDASIFLKLGNDNNTIISDYGLQEYNIETFWNIRFANSSNFRLTTTYTDLTLLNDFDPTRLQADSIFLAAGVNYRFADLNLNFSSDQRKAFSYSIAPFLGNFYNGFRTGISGTFSLRYQPYGFFSLAYEYNYIKLQEPFEPVNLFLIGPRVDYTFSKKLFLTAFFQYNSQLDNVNINARLQWRFKPVSDLYLVFTNNYHTPNLNSWMNRNYALVLKISYWLNI